MTAVDLLVQIKEVDIAVTGWEDDLLHCRRRTALVGDIHHLTNVLVPLDDQRLAAVAKARVLVIKHSGTDAANHTELLAGDLNRPRRAILAQGTAAEGQHTRLLGVGRRIAHAHILSTADRLRLLPIGKHKALLNDLGRLRVLCSACAQRLIRRGRRLRCRRGRGCWGRRRRRGGRRRRSRGRRRRRRRGGRRRRGRRWGGRRCRGRRRRRGGCRGRRRSRLRCGRRRRSRLRCGRRRRSRHHDRHRRCGRFGRRLARKDAAKQRVTLCREHKPACHGQRKQQHDDEHCDQTALAALFLSSAMLRGVGALLPAIVVILILKPLLRNGRGWLGRAALEHGLFPGGCGDRALLTGRKLRLRLQRLLWLLPLLPFKFFKSLFLSCGSPAPARFRRSVLLFVQTVHLISDNVLNHYTGISDFSQSHFRENLSSAPFLS